MSDVLVHAYATQANPDTLPEADVRQALRDANEALWRRDTKIVELTQIAHGFERILTRLCKFQLDSRFADLHAEMERLADHYKQQQAAQATARKVH